MQPNVAVLPCDESQFLGLTEFVSVGGLIYTARFEMPHQGQFTEYCINIRSIAVNLWHNSHHADSWILLRQLPRYSRELPQRSDCAFALRRKVSLKTPFAVEFETPTKKVKQNASLWHSFL